MIDKFDQLSDGCKAAPKDKRAQPTGKQALVRRRHARKPALAAHGGRREYKCDPRSILDPLARPICQLVRFVPIVSN
jgi:hypothetical protein